MVTHCWALIIISHCVTNGPTVYGCGSLYAGAHMAAAELMSPAEGEIHTSYGSKAPPTGGSRLYTTT